MLGPDFWDESSCYQLHLRKGSATVSSQAILDKRQDTTFKIQESEPAKPSPKPTKANSSAAATIFNYILALEGVEAMSNHDHYPPFRATMLASTIRSHLNPRQASSLTTELTDATSTSTTTPLPPSESTWTPHNRPPNLGAIIGGAVGGLAALAVLIMLGVWMYLRRGVKSRSAEGEQEKGVPEMDERVERGKGKGALLQIPEIDGRGKLRAVEGGGGKTVAGA